MLSLGKKAGGAPTGVEMMLTSMLPMVVKALNIDADVVKAKASELEQLARQALAELERKVSQIDARLERIEGALGRVEAMAVINAQQQAGAAGAVIPCGPTFDELATYGRVSA